MHHTLLLTIDSFVQHLLVADEIILGGMTVAFSLLDDP